MDIEKILGIENLKYIDFKTEHKAIFEYSDKHSFKMENPVWTKRMQRKDVLIYNFVSTGFAFQGGRDDKGYVWSGWEYLIRFDKYAIKADGTRGEKIPPTSGNGTDRNIDERYELRISQWPENSPGPKYPTLAHFPQRQNNDLIELDMFVYFSIKNFGDTIKVSPLDVFVEKSRSAERGIFEASRAAEKDPRCNFTMYLWPIE